MKSAVIIGGGLGGLFTGAILSKEGYTVTVLEKNAIIGGGLQSFKRFGELFDTGMHIIGGMQKDGNIRRICEYLGIWDKVHVMDVDPDNIDTIFFSEDKKTYHIAQGKNNYVDSLSKSFPDQRKNLEEYVEAMYKVANEVGLFFLRPSSNYMQAHSEDFHMSADGFIAKYISNKHLQSIVAYMNPLYGGRHSTTPAYIHALISVLYIEGSSRFAGGSVLFAETLKDLIAEHGGNVIAGDPVVQIHSEEKTITGVTTESGKSYKADYYISAIHPCSLFPLLENPSILPKPYRNRLNELPNAYSTFTLNIKLKPNSFKFFNYTMYYMSRYDQIWHFGDTNMWPCGFLFITPPEIKQREFATKLIVTAPMQWKKVTCWEGTKVGNRGSEYEKWKKECTERLLDCMEELYPDFRDCIDDINSASPLTIRDYYGVKEGSICGFSKDCNDLLLSQVPVVTKVPNLLLTGQNCNLHGFCGVTLTAINTCEAILGRNYIVNKINDFEDIRPYLEDEIPAAMKRIASHPLFDNTAKFAFPNECIENVRSKVIQIRSSSEFQRVVMTQVNRCVIEQTCTDFCCEGLENIHPGSQYLFVSNHRDIMLDASLLCYSLFMNGIDTPEITFGANLMQGDFVIDVGKSNKMFKVERPSSDFHEFHRNSKHLSDYIRFDIRQRQQSVWIAQRNGRTKDGIDRTDKGIIKMFAMSGTNNKVESISSLNIVPVSISYEWEPCDILKANELYASLSGPYVKKEGEDLNSIQTGILQKKGRVHISICKPLSNEELIGFEKLPSHSFYKATALLIDKRICTAYKLFPNNYIAHDLRDDNNKYKQFYTEKDKEHFIRHIDNAVKGNTDNRAVRDILIGIYANPVDSKLLFEK